MNWPLIFLGCFVFGFVLSVLSFALSAIHVHVHVPFVHHVHVHVPHVHVHAPHDTSPGMSPVSFPTAMAFLAWFGGTGYLLTTQFGWWAVPAVIGASLAGLTGAAIVFFVMARVLWSDRENMRASDFAIVGALGRLSVPIREGGTGEVVYSLAGTRHTCGARSADGTAIAKGTEVIVTGYERGIASVKPWDDALEEAESRV